MNKAIHIYLMPNLCHPLLGTDSLERKLRLKRVFVTIVKCGSGSQRNEPGQVTSVVLGISVRK